MNLCKPRSDGMFAIVIAIVIAVACGSASSSRAADGENALFFDNVRGFHGVRMRERAAVLILAARIA
ncbi:MAG: hypothetical protein KA144_11510, partial [Xanthomonadaceae bacterium]|nr:hypothetical protein [Xanthomonadaceae bacterium]